MYPISKKVRQSRKVKDMEKGQGPEITRRKERNKQKLPRLICPSAITYSYNVYHEPAQVEPDHGLEPDIYIGSWEKARAGSSLNLLKNPRYRMLKGRT